jgi:NADH-quinone oxidoreductase subunit L
VVAGVLGKTRLANPSLYVGGWVGLAIPLLLFVGACGKSAQFPLHVWLPDAMEGPTPVSALIHAATMVAAGVYLTARMFPIFTPAALSYVAWTGGITAIMGAIIAVTQTDIKKVLAYSTMSQLGFMMLGVGAGAPWAGMFHLTTHAMFKACLFLGSGSVIHAMHHAQDLKDMGGLRRKMPVTFWTFVLSTAALAGLPFTSGFLSKDAILVSALANHDLSGHTTLFWIGVVAAFLTAFYMTRLVWLCFMGEPRNRHKYEHAHESPRAMVLPLVVLAAFSVWFIWSTTHFEAKFFATPAYFEDFPDTSSVRAAYADPNGHLEHPHAPGWFGPLAMALGVVGIGVGLAYFASGRRDEKSKVLPGPLHDLSEGKFFMDEMYLDGMVAFGNRTAENCNWVDSRVVDGAVNVSGTVSLLIGDISGDADAAVVDGAVNLTASTAQGAGAAASAAQSGKLRNYITAALGVTALAIVLLVFVF